MKIEKLLFKFRQLEISYFVNLPLEEFSSGFLCSPNSTSHPQRLRAARLFQTSTTSGSVAEKVDGHLHKFYYGFI